MIIQNVIVKMVTLTMVPYVKNVITNVNFVLKQVIIVNHALKLQDMEPNVNVLMGFLIREYQNVRPVIINARLVLNKIQIV